MSAHNSTIVRTQHRDRILFAPRPPRGPLPLRAVFAALDVVAPDVAARLARHLWFRLPVVPPRGRRAKHVPVGGVPFTVRHDGVEVHGTVYGPDDAPTAHLVHGWGGWWQQLGAHVEPLLAAGYRVVAHDAMSHGDSPAGRHGPRSATMPEMAKAFAAVAWQQGPADLVVAHSIGAMVAMQARADGHPAGAYVFIAPAVDVEVMFPWFQHVLGVGDRTVPRLRSRVEAHVGMTIDDFSLVAAAHRLEQPGTTPLLVVHSRDDADNPAQGSVDLVEAWPGADLVLTDGLGHRRILWDPTTVARVADFARSARGDAVDDEGQEVGT